MRSVRIVASRCASLVRRDQRGLGPGPPEDRQRRQALDGVEEVPAEPVQQPPLRAGVVLGLPADQRHEHRDQRQGQRDDQRREPVGVQHDDEHGDRHEHREHQLRQVARDVVVERVEPARGQGRQLAGVERRRVRPRAGHVGHQAAAQLRLHRRRAAQGRRLRAVGQRGARERDDSDQRDDAADVGPAPVGVEHGSPRHRPGHQPRLQQDQPGEGDAAGDGHAPGAPARRAWCGPAGGRAASRLYRT